MDTVAAKLQLIVERYKTRSLDNGDGMLPPVNANVMADAERHMGFRFPESLRSIFAWSGGQEYICPGVTGIFGKHRLMSPSEIVKDYQMYEEAVRSTDIELPPSDAVPSGEKGMCWHPALIPFAGWDAYSLMMCRHTGRIWEFEPYLGLSGRSYLNIDQLLDAVLHAAISMDEPVLDFIATD